MILRHERADKEISIQDAKYEAQKLAFGPLYFQAVIALRDLGILAYISKHREGVGIPEICVSLELSDYGVRVLLEAAESANIVSYLDENVVKLTKTGFILLHDEMTRVNMNFVNDVCYLGAKALTECVKTGKPEGLKVFGNWNTIYEGLSELPPKVKKSWFEFDHYYSDAIFNSALEIVLKDEPEYLFDIGGNTGKWAFACCEKNAAMKIKILDLPGQLNVAKQNVRENGLLNRIDFHEINLLDQSQEIPPGADVIWMSQFLDCFSSEEILSILERVCRASSDNTTIYILETFYNNQNYPASQYCLSGTSLYFAVMANGNSKMYSKEAMESLVDNAGLEVIQVYPLINNGYHSILKCRKKVK